MKQEAALESEITRAVVHLAQQYLNLATTPDLGVNPRHELQSYLKCCRS